MSRRAYGQLLTGIGALIALIGYFVLPFISVFIFSVTAYQVLTFPASSLQAASQTSAGNSSSFPTGILFLGAVLFCIAVGAVCALTLPIIPRGPGFARGLFGFLAAVTGVIGFVLLILFVLTSGTALLDFFSNRIYAIYGGGFYAMLLGLVLVTVGGVLIVSTDD